MIESLVHTITAMGTVISIQIVGDGTTREERRARSAAVERAAHWFTHLNDTCTRFDPTSPLRQLTTSVGIPVTADPLLFEAIHFGMAVAEATGGAYDPTIGHYQEHRGFNREYQSGRVVDAGLAPNHTVSFRDVILDPATHSITITRPLVFDLGGLAKGLAIDLAAKELAAFNNLAIDAGGDLYLRGHNAEGRTWSVGVRHPRHPDQLLAAIPARNTAVCTSGDYERPGKIQPAEHHLYDPRHATSATSLVSATVLAPTAIVADALATAAFVLGPTEGLEFLRAQGVEGLLVTPSMEQIRTEGMPSE